MALRFEWDPDKAAVNLRKHRVGFEEASTVFGDPLSITILDPERGEGEFRYVLIGQSQRRRVLVVCHTERGETIRIVSARRASRREKNEYEEG